MSFAWIFHLPEYSFFCRERKLPRSHFGKTINVRLCLGRANRMLIFLSVTSDFTDGESMEPRVAGHKGAQYLSITGKSESDRVFGKNNRGRKVREEKSGKLLGITGRSDEAEPSYWSLCLSLCSFRRRDIEVVPEGAGASVMGLNVGWTPEWKEALASH
nr:hypothetical protein [Endozoicomonas sp.]